MITTVELNIFIYFFIVKHFLFCRCIRFFSHSLTLGGHCVSCNSINQSVQHSHQRRRLAGAQKGRNRSWSYWFCFTQKVPERKKNIQWAAVRRSEVMADWLETTKAAVCWRSSQKATPPASGLARHLAAALGHCNSRLTKGTKKQKRVWKISNLFWL